MAGERQKKKLATEVVAARAARRRRNRWPLIAGLALGLLAGVFWFAIPGETENTDQATGTVAPQTDIVLAPEQKNRPATATIGEQAVEDDGQLLWISPTTGDPVSLDYLPLGTQLLLHLRPADLLAHAEGEKVLAALGTWGERSVAQLQRSTGAQIDEIVAFAVAIHPGEHDGLGCTLRLQLTEPWTDQQLAQQLPNGSESTLDGQRYFVTGGRACFLPIGNAGRTLVSCPTEVVAELVERGETPPPFPRDMQRLLRRTDAQRMATLVFPTKFLQTSGASLLQGSAKRLREALDDLLGGDAGTVALSVHWDKNFFLELQSTVALATRPHAFAAALERRLALAPDKIESTVLSGPLHPYGREVIARFPAMLGELSNYTRTAESQGISVARCYLPLPAGHNLLMAAELTFSTSHPASQGVLDSAPSEKPQQTIAEKLQQITTLSFPKETLQQALEILAEDLGVPIEIRGRDLQLEGITKNQSFGIDLQDRPAAEILLAVLRRANPDPTASSAADPKQKLVYVVRETVGDRPGAIVVTTRSAATERGDLLPTIFQPAKR